MTSIICPGDARAQSVIRHIVSMDTIPTSSPSSTTGKCRIPAASMVAIALPTASIGVGHLGFALIHSRIRTSSGSA